MEKITIGNKVFEISFIDSVENDFRKYLKAAHKKRGNGYLAESSQKNYVKKLFEFCDKKMVDLNAGSQFNIYKLDIYDKNIMEILNQLRDIMRDYDNKNSDKFCSGDPASAILYYRDFVKTFRK